MDNTICEPEVILLDENKEAENCKFYRVGTWSVSPTHNCVAYSEDRTGNEKYTLKFLDLSSGEGVVMEDSIPNCAGKSFSCCLTIKYICPPLLTDLYL